MNENKQYVSKINGYYIKDSDARESIGGKADQSTTYTKTEVDTALGNKADKSTTLDGYGITDAYTKSEVDSALINKFNSGDFAIITGTQTLQAMEQSDTNYKHNSWTVAYPTGFTKDNTYVLSFGGKLNLSDHYNAYGLANTVSMMLVTGSLPRTIGLNTNDHIGVAVWNPSTSEQTYNYKILLMKIDPEEEPEEITNGGE